KGARQVRAAYPPPASVSIFILPPSVAALLERLGQRGSESPDGLRRRLRRAVEEIREAARYDYVLVNDDLAGAVQAVSAIIDGSAGVPRRPADFEQRLDALARDLAQAAGNAPRRACGGPHAMLIITPVDVPTETGNKHLGVVAAATLTGFGT